MQKSGALFLIIGIVLILNSSIIYSNSSDSLIIQNNELTKELRGNSHKIINQEIISEFLEGNDFVNVIIEMKDTNNNNNRIKTSKMNTMALDNRNIQVKHQYTSSPSFSARISSQELDALLKEDLIKAIYYDYPVRTLLDYSVPLINATQTWSLNDQNLHLTGAGETVCIIDTGIDFTHPALIGRNLTCNIDCINGCSENCLVLDDNSHGTHVAGIVGASGLINGVATEVNMIGVKALNSAGDGSMADVIAGINWCTDNSEEYNISVISMSLGTSALYSDYCDNNAETSAINAAVLKNISVVVATGNNGDPSNISSPACSTNSTAVAMTYKKNYGSITWSNGQGEICSDQNANETKLVCWSNRNHLHTLVAPGSNINSTWPDNKYTEASGTSMATPHVSGAIAIIKQYLKINERQMTPKEIENVLNITGKQIYDDASGNNYSRIDVYSAILSLDIYPPVVELLSPENGTESFEFNHNFECSATDIFLKNISLFVWNETELVLTNSSNTNENSFVANFSHVLDIGNYNWNCFACDEQENCAFAEENKTLKIKEAILEVNSPKNITYASNYIEINITGNGEEIWYNWNGTEVTYQENQIVYFPIGVHTLQAKMNYSEDNVKLANVTFQIKKPCVNFKLPLPPNSSIEYENSWSGVQFETISEIGGHNWWINDTENFTINNTGFLNWSKKLPAGNYYVNVSLNNTYGDINHTIYNLNISKTISNIILHINNSENNFSTNLDNAKNVYLNASLITGQGEIQMYLYDTLINQGASPLFNLTNLEVGAYYFNATYEGNENYTKSNNELLINITENMKLEINTNASQLEFGIDSINISWNTTASKENLLEIKKPNGEILFNTTINNGEITLNPNNLTIQGTYNVTLFGKDFFNKEQFNETNFTINLIPIILSNLSNQEITTSNSTFQVSINSNATCNIKYGTNLSLSNKSIDSVNKQNHNLTIENLNPNTLYYYQWNCSKSDLQHNLSEIYFFTTINEIEKNIINNTPTDFEFNMSIEDIEKKILTLNVSTNTSINNAKIRLNIKSSSLYNQTIANKIITSDIYYINSNNLNETNLEFILFKFYYDEILEGVNESSLKIYWNNGTEWIEIQSGVNQEYKYVWGNRTGFSEYLIAGDLIQEEDTTDNIQAPNNNNNNVLNSRGSSASMMPPPKKIEIQNISINEEIKEITLNQGEEFIIGVCESSYNLKINNISENYIIYEINEINKIITQQFLEVKQINLDPSSNCTIKVDYSYFEANKIKLGINKYNPINKDNHTLDTNLVVEEQPELNETKSKDLEYGINTNEFNSSSRSYMKIILFSLLTIFPLCILFNLVYKNSKKEINLEYVSKRHKISLKNTKELFEWVVISEGISKDSYKKLIEIGWSEKLINDLRRIKKP